MKDNIISELPKTSLVSYIDALPSFDSGDVSDVPSNFVQSTEIKPVVVDLVVGTEQQELEADFQTIRKNLVTASVKTSEVLDKLISLSQDTESPRSYEVLVAAINSLTATNKEILETHSKRADIKKKLGIANVPEHQTNVQTNNVFVGSTSELLDIINTRK